MNFTKGFIVIGIVLFLVSIGVLQLILYIDKLSMSLENPKQNYFYSRKNRELSSTTKTLPRVILFGDSRMEMWGDQLKIDGYQIINRGIGGETTSQLLLRVENDILAINADKVVIQVGINDLKTIVFFENRKDKIINETKNNILDIVNKLKAKEVNVYLMTIIPASEPIGLWRFFWSEEIDRQVKSTNRFIRQQHGKNVTIIDSAPIFNHGEKLNPEYTLDTLHMNNAGYSVLADLLTKTLQQN